MNIAIDVKLLTKVYRTYQKEPGFFGALKGLAHRRYKETVAARGVSLQVKEGELVGFLGPEWSGQNHRPERCFPACSIPTSGEARVLGYVPWKRQNDFKRQFSP